MRMDLSVIIPVKDDIRIRRCIESIDETVEPVIVLNTPSKDVLEIVKGLDATVTEIEDNNLARAYNKGIEASSYDNMLFMDSDCTFDLKTIRKLYDGLKEAPLSKGKVEFASNSWISKVVALSREYHVTDIINAYSPPLAFKKSIKDDIGGMYYNDILFWTEDHEFDQRVQKAGLNLHYDETATIQHGELSPKADLRSSFHYGGGYFEGIKAGITQPGFMYGGNKNTLKSMGLDVLRTLSLPAFIADVTKKKNFATAVYMTAWMASFAAGYYSQACFDFLGAHKK
ncbi:glycosyltransferase [Candidatus Woesearchaeota archaeon]|nr:glycosyltransferase [Candidatus Woesearchaeota archaeon]